MQPPNEMPIKRAIKTCAPTRTMRPASAMRIKARFAYEDLRPPNTMLIKRAIKACAPTRTMRSLNAMLIIAQKHMRAELRADKRNGEPKSEIFFKNRKSKQVLFELLIP
jgi:hypothetical protein